MLAFIQKMFCASPELTRPRGSHASPTRRCGGLRLFLCRAMPERPTGLNTLPTSRCGYGEDRGGRCGLRKTAKGMGLSTEFRICPHIF